MICEIVICEIVICRKVMERFSLERERKSSMGRTENYERWLAHVKEADVLEELESIRGNEEEINDRFYRELEFGTGGLRGVIGAGTYRMNVYTVAKATQGYSNYLTKTVKTGAPSSPSVAIAYDLSLIHI